MKRDDRMKNMILQLCNILEGLQPTQANELEIAGILSNVALSHNAPAHIYDKNGRRKEVEG